jgi:sigma-B regulation protein RsbU (phosphoserine phosphatase)
MLSAFLLVVTGRTASIERLVMERTAELSRANTALEHEITERKQTEAALAAAQEHEATIASRIQQTLLLGRPLDAIPGLQMATLTIPSQHVDGDFYDCVQHTDQCFDILIGDVMGKGVPAALVGAALKSQFLRAFGQLALASAQSTLPSPAALVNAMHAEVTAQLITLESFATLCLARFEMPQRRVTFVDCGHTRTMHFRHHTGTCQPLQGANMPLGFSPQEVYTESAIDFDEGDIFVFYSDGITETQNAAGELFGEDRLASIIHAHSHVSPDALIAAIHQAVVAFSPTGRSTDDLTCLVLTMARHEMATPRVQREIVVTSDPAVLAHVRAFIRSVCEDTLQPALDEEHTSHIELAVNEAASNIMQHAYHDQADQRIDVSVCVFDHHIIIRLTHWGDRFTSACVATPAFDGSQDRGFGLFLLAQFMDDVQYTSEPSGVNVVHLVKHLSTPNKGLNHGHTH